MSTCQIGKRAIRLSAPSSADATRGTPSEQRTAGEPEAGRPNERLPREAEDRAHRYRKINPSRMGGNPRRRYQPNDADRWGPGAGPQDGGRGARWKNRRGEKTKTDLAFTESRTIEEATRRQIEIVSYAFISQCSLEILLS